MPPSTPSTRDWGVAVGYAAFAYGLHKIGAILLFYQRFFWFQMVTHFVSASALALVLLRAGQAVGLSGSDLLTLTVVGVAAGAVCWELIEYLDLIPWLHWWGLDDSLLDMTMNTVGLATVLARHRTALRDPPTVLDPDPPLPGAD